MKVTNLRSVHSSFHARQGTENTQRQTAAGIKKKILAPKNKKQQRFASFATCFF